MKKTLLLACLLLATSSMSFAATANNTFDCNRSKSVQKQQMQKQQKPDFEKRLNLTEAQKLQAKAIRQQGHEKMKPVFEQIKSKKEQKNLLMKNENPGVAEVKALGTLNKEIVSLKDQLRAIRAENNKKFEAILTDAQKKEFEKMKQEGRREFKKHHQKQKSFQPCDKKPENCPKFSPYRD